MNDLISRSSLLRLCDMYTCQMISRQDILKAPAIDAVPVVRCNRCKYYEQDTGFCQYFGGGSHWDGFCNNGARMDGEADG